jgi:hypothetical protein
MSLKVYTFYTDSHKKLLEEYFIPTFNETNSDLSLEVKKFEQKCSSGNYMSSGWYQIMMNKVDYILSSIDESWGKVFIHADCDIVFFGSIKEDILQQMEEKDIAAQNDGNEICCGFFACKANEKTKSLFEQVKKEMNEKFNDQQATNKLVKKYVSYKYLNERYYSIYRNTNKKVWEKGVNINEKEIPKEMLVYHANWTVGVENKIELMNKVKKIIYDNRKKHNL